MSMIHRNKETLRSAIKGVPFAMLTTQDADGSLHSRPMVSLEGDDEKVLWFFADRSTQKITDVAAQPLVNVSYSDVDMQVFVSVSGMAELVTDPVALAARWRPEYHEWLPLNIGDNRLSLLKITVESVMYWKPPTAHIGRTMARTIQSSSQDANPS
jgi:general stress protein 26